MKTDKVYLTGFMLGCAAALLFGLWLLNTQAAPLGVAWLAAWGVGIGMKMARRQ
jgi:hypothetical protein